MSYVLTVQKEFKARQGLVSPVRKTRNLPALQPADGYLFRFRAGIRFADDQLTERGWYVDTDAVDALVAAVCAELAAATWTELFPFRPTFENVARWAFQELRPTVGQLSFVELDNVTLGIGTRYSPG